MESRAATRETRDEGQLVHGSVQSLSVYPVCISMFSITLKR